VHGHVHLGVTLHAAEHAPVRLVTRLVDQPPLEEDAEEQRHKDDHQRPADELAERELPAEQQRHKDPELDHQVRRGELERHRRREIRALAKQRARKRNGGVGAGRGGGTKAAGDPNRARRVVRHEPTHLPLRHHGLHCTREREAEDQRPEDLPEHPERERERLHDLAADGRDDDHRSASTLRPGKGRVS
jgi:hypothetical protein